jgi:hypothetical protein
VRKKEVGQTFEDLPHLLKSVFVLMVSSLENVSLFGREAGDKGLFRPDRRQNRPRDVSHMHPPAKGKVHEIGRGGRRTYVKLQLEPFEFVDGSGDVVLGCFDVGVEGLEGRFSMKSIDQKLGEQLPSQRGWKKKARAHPFWFCPSKTEASLEFWFRCNDGRGLLGMVVPLCEWSEQS